MSAHVTFQLLAILGLFGGSGIAAIGIINIKHAGT